jgi:integrase
MRLRSRHPAASPDRSPWPQAVAVLKATEKSLLCAHIVLSLLTGVRTEEARALRWDHVELDRSPVPESADDEGRGEKVS